MKFDAISFKNQNNKKTELNWDRDQNQNWVSSTLKILGIILWNHFASGASTLARWHVGRTLKSWSQGCGFESSLTLRVSDVVHRTSGRIGRRAALRHRRRRHRRRRRWRYSQRRRDVVPTDVGRRRRRYRRNRVDVVVARVEVHFLVIVMLILMKHLVASML